jgi:DNA-3-methyladenine glycosylase
MKLPLSFYQQKDVSQVAKQLLGKFLFTKIDDELLGGMIVETEGYGGIHDKASHAFQNRYTERTKPLYENGGIAYVYLCYGMHYLLNVVTNKKDIPHAVLIRAIEPTHGIEAMLRRKNKTKLDKTLTSGPGALCKALGITLKHNRLKFTSSIMWIEDKKIDIKEENIVKSPRVGVAYAKEDALLPLRFRIENNKWTSPAK